MSKLTWKEATLNHIKDLVTEKKNLVFSIKDLSQVKLQYILVETKSRSKSPERNLDKTLRELRDLNILKHCEDIEGRVYEYIPANHNEELIYKDKRSIGHIRITKCLDRLSIKYEEEKTFHDLKHVSFLRLDIYFTILGRKLAIEYDGSQHQKAVEIWGGKVSLQQGQKRDEIKNKYCIQNGITLHRVTHDIKDIEQHVQSIIQQIIREYLYSCILTVFMQLYTCLCKTSSFVDRKIDLVDIRSTKKYNRPSNYDYLSALGICRNRSTTRSRPAWGKIRSHYCSPSIKEEPQDSY